jgi:fumarate reductase subunit D
MSQIRPFLTLLIGFLVSLGVLPQDVADYVQANGDQLLGAVMVLWGLVAFLRNRRDAKAKSG